MCGLAGWVGPGVEPGWLERATRQLRHRGPDDTGTMCWPSTGKPAVGLAHTRLAILDLSAAGAQPLAGPDGRYHLVYNGEVYNYLELRAELEAAGEVFTSRSDTEVVLRALTSWGPEALNRFTGMFALALLDTQARTVLLARDPFGMKPLHLATVAGATVFASELGVLLETAGVSRRAAPAAVHDFLAFGLVDHTDQTMFADIRRLPAGTYAVLRLDRPEEVAPVSYSVHRPYPLAETTAGRTEQLRQLFLDSTRLHLRSDVPVGAALSGGIDSSSVVAAMRAVGPPDMDLHTFTYAAGDPSLDELAWARQAAAAAGATTHVVRADAAQISRDLDELLTHQGEPVPGSSMYAQWQVFRAARDAGVTVLLDGQGGDELFAGYRPFLWSSVAEDLRAGHLRAARAQVRIAAALDGTGSPASIWARSLVQALPRSTAAALARGRSRPVWLNHGWFADRCPTPRLRPGGRQPSLRAAMEEAARHSVLPSLLRYEDRNSMAFSRESRLPFLTPELARFAAGVPRTELLGPDGRGKWLLREAMRGLVPDPILDRRDKVGFTTPESAWLHDCGPWLLSMLEADLAGVPALLAAPVLAVARDVAAGKAVAGPEVWRWLSLVRWARLFEVEWS